MNVKTGHPDLIKPESTFSFVVAEQNVGQRLDCFMSEQFPLYSRSFFQQVIDKKCILINNDAAKKNGVKLRIADVISITFPPQETVDTSEQAIAELGIKLIYENEHFLIIYKPAGVLVHRPNTGSVELTLADWITHHFQDIKDVGSIDRPGIVHRLDKNTSGLLIVPRTNWAHGKFGDMFKQRIISKTYYAIVHGHPDRKGSIDFPIGRDPHFRIRMKAYNPSRGSLPKNDDTRESLTNYEISKYFQEHSLVKVKLITGRTHQIRAHFSALGHPLVGDTVYGKKSKLIDRQALHAHTISFTFNDKQYSFSQDIPNDMDLLTKTLKPFQE